jgi:hypothetical protein
MVSAAAVQPSDPLKLVAEAMAKAAEALGDGECDRGVDGVRSEAAKRGFVSRAVYSICYYASYSVVLPTLFLAHAVPGARPIGSGLSDGASAASTTIRKMRPKKAQHALEQHVPIDEDEAAMISEGATICARL